MREFLVTVTSSEITSYVVHAVDEKGAMEMVSRSSFYQHRILDNHHELSCSARERTDWEVDLDNDED